jgi:hypothetical protein
LVGVLPATAQRFRVRDPELAAALGTAGAQIVESSPDVEIGPLDGLEGEAPFILVESKARESIDKLRLVRAGHRAAGAALVRAGTIRARAALRRRGYNVVREVTWERGVSLHGAFARPRLLAHRFPLCTMLVAVRGNKQPKSMLDATLEAAEHSLARPVHPDQGVLLGASGLLFARSGDAFLRIALGPAADPINEQRTALEELKTFDPPAVVAERVPWILGAGREGISVWSAERHRDGAMPPPELADRVLSQSLEFLAALHSSSRSEPQGLTPIELAGIIRDRLGPDHDNRVEELAERFAERVSSLPRGFGHGDFWSGNLLAERGELRGVVDWPAAGAGRLPLLDVFHLQLSSIRERTRAYRGTIVVGELLPDVRAGGGDTVHEYCRRLGLELSPAELEALLGIYWLETLVNDLIGPDRDPHHVYHGGWRSANIADVVAAFTHRGQTTHCVQTVRGSTRETR